jgi:uncharacterized protein (DUF2267 family)
MPSDIGIEPIDAVRAVMCTVSQHVSGGEARHVWRALPDPIKAVLERCMLHRDEPAKRFGRDELLVRIAGHLGSSLEEAEHATSAVLAAISARLPQKDVADVAAQLPVELRELWYVPRTPLGPTVAQHPILTRIEQAAPLPHGVTGEGAFKCVMCNLSKRLSRGEAKHLFQELPSDLRELVASCLEARGEAPELFDRNRFFERIARDLRMPGDLSGAEKTARTVFRYVEEYVTASLFKHITSQLPRDLSDIWGLPELE